MELRRQHQVDNFVPGAEIFEFNSDSDLDDVDEDEEVKVFIPSDKPAPERMAPSEVRLIADERCRNLFASWETLRAIIMRHEASIQDTWIKKKNQARLKILLSAWPDMAPNHRPDFAAFRKENPAGDRIGFQTKYRHHYMWPYINQEDLLKRKTLLLMLNSRARHFPSYFAAADNQATHIGRITNALVPIFLNEHVMLLNGVEEPNEYGLLVSWRDHPDAFKWMYKQRQFLPGDGLLILEAQERLLAFLVDCCTQILHDIPVDILTSYGFPIQPEPQLKATGETQGFESLATIAAEAVYRVPATLDLDRIIAMLGAKASAAEDHFWSLREDPTYFSSHVLDAKEHRQEILDDNKGKPHPIHSSSQQNSFWSRVLSRIVIEAYMQLEMFSELYRQARELLLLQEKYAAELVKAADLPEEFLRALIKFQFYLNQTAKGPMNDLKHTFVASPPVRKFFVRDATVDPNSSLIQINKRPGASMTETEEELLWFVRTLWEDNFTLFLARLPLVLDELERLLRTEPGALNCMSSFIAGSIGDLSVISNCLTQLDLYQPWAQSFEAVFKDQKEEIEKEFKQRTRQINAIVSTMNEKQLSRAAKLGTPSEGRFFHPADKRRTKANIDAMRQAEQNLDEFWAAIDQLVKSECGNLNGTAVREFLLQPRILQRTAEWVDEPTPSAKHSRRESIRSVHVDDVYKPLSDLYLGTKTTNGDNQSCSHSTKSKLKARRKSSTQIEPVPEDASGESSEQPQLKPRPGPFAVDARALKAFRVLFFNPLVTSSPGEVSWTDFLHAMNSTGVFTAERLYGSAWQFQKINEDIEGPVRIQFHEPHPRGKFRFVQSRRIGRSLNRAFGWTGDMFVLKEK